MSDIQEFKISDNESKTIITVTPSGDLKINLEELGYVHKSELEKAYKSGWREAKRDMSEIKYFTSVPPNPAPDPKTPLSSERRGL